MSSALAGRALRISNFTQDQKNDPQDLLFSQHTHTGWQILYRLSSIFLVVMRAFRDLPLYQTARVHPLSHYIVGVPKTKLSAHLHSTSNPLIFIPPVGLSFPVHRHLQNLPAILSSLTNLVHLVYLCFLAPHVPKLSHFQPSSIVLLFQEPQYGLKKC